ncbi:MAG: thiaminase II [Nitrospinaceae bacterium]|nr:thiaminase II [Nitrospinaceae bacterium]NIR57758.1 thiaminase II [Nitrospinaceae bacterium]NIS88220.1 thiaminase II [Nitrospinaceae bacterium]NIT85100.1 thiaminase II [Nitrospinaceae bacterium]NIU47257.1 thiaminase II [Nitrospinaceae bacterium]
MLFSKEVWAAIEPIYTAILEHPFNQELAQGTLPKDKFQFYMKQDALYLVDFSRALALAASRAPNPRDQVLLLDFSKGAIEAERELHEYYFDLYGIQLDVGQAPGCFTYTHFLLASAGVKSYGEGLAGLLPCFWIYQEVGVHIYKSAAPGNPYQKWIDMYSGKEYQEIVRSAIDLTDRTAAEANAHQVLQMKEAFIVSTRLEWMFWDSAYRMEPWPV